MKDDNILINQILQRNHFDYMLKNKDHKLCLVYTNDFDNINSSFCQVSCNKKHITKEEQQTNISNSTIINNIKKIVDIYIDSNYVSDIEIITDNKSIEQSAINIISDKFIKNNISDRSIIINSVYTEGCQNIFNKYTNKLKNNILKINLHLFCDKIKKVSDILDIVNKYNCNEVYLKLTPNNILDVLRLFNDCKNNVDEVEFLIKSIKIEQSTNDWNDLSISYLNLIYALIANILLTKYRDREEFFNYIFNSNTLVSLSDNQMFDCNDRFRCGFQTNLFVNCEDNSIICCPGLQQSMYKIATIKNGRITAQNISAEILKDHSKLSVMPHCEKCPYSPFCQGFCLAESFNEKGNVFIPHYHYCKMLSYKYSFLLTLYENLGLNNYLQKHKDDNKFYQYILNMEILHGRTK